MRDLQECENYMLANARCNGASRCSVKGTRAQKNTHKIIGASLRFQDTSKRFFVQTDDPAWRWRRYVMTRKLHNALTPIQSAKYTHKISVESRTHWVNFSHCPTWCWQDFSTTWIIRNVLTTRKSNYQQLADDQRLAGPACQQTA